MAESVDALVSNTSGATHPGSSPGLGTGLKSGKCCNSMNCGTFYFSVGLNRARKYSHRYHTDTICRMAEQCDIAKFS